MPAEYSWCFSHGTLHESRWCTAFWVPLKGARTVDEAMAAKRDRFGEAEFIDALPLDQQREVMDGWRSR